MWGPARPARRVFERVLHVKSHEAMLSFVMRGQKVTATQQKLGCGGSGNSGLSWGHHAAGLFQRCWNKAGNGLQLVVQLYGSAEK